jgi:ABC-type multidrug transport system ATPase subunit
MNIKVEGLGKRYNYEWIFRNLNYQFQKGSEYAIVGANGSGKSTLAKVVSGFTPSTEGKITYESEGKNIEVEEVYKRISFAAPYLELIEEFTLKELYQFHYRFKMPTLSFDGFVERLKLQKATEKQVKFFSSGMKQRIKLGFAFYSESELLILDEPTSNLDHQGFNWYLNEIIGLIGSKIILICSNQENEYEFCKHYLKVESLK